MKKFKKYGRMVLILMLALVVALVPCLNCYAFAVSSSATAMMVLLALSGVTLMHANMPSSVAQNMYRDISTIATQRTHEMYLYANAILNFTADYSVKVANATGDMIEVTGINLSNAINGLKNYLTYKNVNGAYDGIVISNTANSLNLQKMANINTAVSTSSSATNISRTISNDTLMNYFDSKMNNVALSNIVLHSTKNFYNANYDAFMNLYPEFASLNTRSFESSGAMATALSSAYSWLTGTFANYTQSVTFNDIYMDMNDERVKVSVEFISFLLSDGLMHISFVRDSVGDFVGYSFLGGETYNNRTWDKFTFTALPYAYFLATPSGTSIPRIMSVMPTRSTSSSGDIRLSYIPEWGYTTFVNGSINQSYSNSDVYFDDTVAFSSSAVAIPRVTGSAVGQDVFGIPDIPDAVISGQYNTDVADRIGTVVGGADVIGLNVPVDTGADVYNPSIDALIGSGTLTSDVVIDGTTIATGTDVITGVQTAVGDIATTTDTVLDLDVSPDAPGTPTFPDVFPGLWDWVNNLVDNALQWFIFCGDIFSALPGAIKYTFLGGMTTVLAVGVIKKLLF